MLKGVEVSEDDRQEEARRMIIKAASLAALSQLFNVSVISRMFFIFSTGFGAPLGKIKLNQFQPGE